jgi:hypothetical protein
LGQSLVSDPFGSNVLGKSVLTDRFPSAHYPSIINESGILFIVSQDSTTIERT